MIVYGTLGLYGIQAVRRIHESRKTGVAAHLQAIFLAISTAALDIGLKSYRQIAAGTTKLGLLDLFYTSQMRINELD